MTPYTEITRSQDGDIIVRYVRSDGQALTTFSTGPVYIYLPDGTSITTPISVRLVPAQEPPRVTA